MKPATTSSHFAALYRQAFDAYGAAALWNFRAIPNPSREDALAITEALRIEGDLAARRLAYEIERACHAA